MDLSVIYEDADIIAFNKPSGIVVHPARVAGKGIVGDGKTVADWLREHRPEVKDVGDDPETRPGIVHRLDKETSGVLVAAKTQEAFGYMKALFQHHKIKKRYRALVHGVPKEAEGRIEKPIGLINGTLRRTVRGGRMQKAAVTRYRRRTVIHDGGAMYGMLDVMPETGRTHQIRVHLASIGHAVVGDPLYGRKRQPPWASRLALHACEIAFIGRSGAHVVLAVEPGGDFPHPPSLSYPQREDAP